MINDNFKTATTFNNHFVTQFSQENLHRIPNQVKMFQGSSEEELNSITFEESSICNKLEKLNASKSPGNGSDFPNCAKQICSRTSRAIECIVYKELSKWAGTTRLA